MEEWWRSLCASSTIKIFSRPSFSVANSATSATNICPELVFLFTAIGNSNGILRLQLYWPDEHCLCI